MLDASTVTAVLAQSAEQDVPLPVILFYIGIPAFSLVAVGVACWIFWRAKRREDEQLRVEELAAQQPNEKELTWRNARSS